MNKTVMTVLLIVGIIIAVVSIGSVGAYVSAANYGNRAETSLQAKYNDNKNVLGQYTLKIGEMAQVPTIARNDLREILQTAFEGRYGSDGSQAAFQWIKEQNPTIDQTMYLQIQKAIEAGRNDFTASQTELLDQKREYVTELGYVWSGFWLHLAGYPKIDLNKINIVVASDTEEKFKTGVDEGIKLRRN
jgi:hypothetical protein